MRRDPTCVFAVDEGLIVALEAVYGPPIDSYLNGWQVWVEPVGPPGADGEPIELEHKLHTPEGFTQPDGLSHHDLWDEVVQQVADGARILELGTDRRRLHEVWTLLEVYPAFGAPISAEALRTAAEAALGRPALAAGTVDHAGLGARWKRTKGRFDLPGALLEQLGVR